MRTSPPTQALEMLHHFSELLLPNEEKKKKERTGPDGFNFPLGSDILAFYIAEIPLKSTPLLLIQIFSQLMREVIRCGLREAVSAIAQGAGGWVWASIGLDLGPGRPYSFAGTFQQPLFTLLWLLNYSCHTHILEEKGRETEERGRKEGKEKRKEGKKKEERKEGKGKERETKLNKKERKEKGSPWIQEAASLTS